jgi:hypothetical protein
MEQEGPEVQGNVSNASGARGQGTVAKHDKLL